MHVRRLTAVIAAALLLPLGACTDGDSKADPPEPTTSGSPTPSETASAGPTLPAAAQGTDEAAAKAFVRFYFGLISDAMVTGETENLRQFSYPSCKSCSQVARTIDDLYAKGGSLKTDGWQPTKFIVGKPVRGGHGFYLRVTQHTRTVLDDGELVGKTPEAVLSMHISVRWKEGLWRTAKLEMLR